MRSIRMKEGQAGFTLLELMIVTAIIAVISAIAVPSLFNPDNKVRALARDLAGDMQATRMGAIKANADWAIFFDTANDQYLICSDNGSDGTWSTTSDNTIEKTVALGSYTAGVSYGDGPATVNANTPPGSNLPSDGVSYGSNVVTFNNQGTCNAGWVYITYGESAYAIGTLSTGLVRIRRWTGGSWQ